MECHSLAPVYFCSSYKQQRYRGTSAFFLNQTKSDRIKHGKQRSGMFLHGSDLAAAACLHCMANCIGVGSYLGPIAAIRDMC
mmetsp:Transcript_20761/g.26813  ORF Transcript_20761/g.26813 Transcript_20761/m.26813 type:complete len:82 (-) Transcript_20761:302-547(-)